MDTEGRPRLLLLAILLLSAASLADEIVLIRLLSVRFWPHFVPLIVAQAMLGLGAAGVALFLLRTRLAKAPGRAFAWMTLATAPSFDLAFRVSQCVPFDPFLLMWDLRAWPAFGLFFVVLSVPFFLAGVALAIPFAFRLGEPGTIYAASFAGSAAGALLSVPAFAFVATESLLRVPAGLGLLAGLCVLAKGTGRVRTGQAAAWVLSLALLAAPSSELRLSPYKDLAVSSRLPGAATLAHRSGPYGDFRALFAPGIHSAPGLSFRFDGEVPPQSLVFADGEARGVVPQGGGKQPPLYLRYLPAALPYRLLDRPSVLQFGLRGTEGVLAAAANGAGSVMIVEPAREYARMIEEDLARFSGGWPPTMATEVRAEGARNFLAGEGVRFDLIEVADISSATFASLGIHAAGETYLLTGEGLGSAFGRLTGRGMLSFAGWLKAPARESVKILRSVRRELERAGDAPAADRVLMVRGWGTFALVVRRTPFGSDDVLRARRFCEETGFSLVWPPGEEGSAGGGVEERSVRESVADALTGIGGSDGQELFDLRPVTDDSPYFHRFLRLSSIPEFRRLLGSQWVPFVEWGVVFLVLSLAVSALLASLILLLPLAGRRRGAMVPGVPLVAYFSALGLGYMLVELVFLKIGLLVLGNPVMAAAAAIGGFTFFSGMGSALSHRATEEPAMRRRVFPGIAALGLGGYLVLARAAPFLLAAPEGVRMAAFLACLAPAAVLMGIPFPAGVSRLSERRLEAVPFALAVNGVFSVTGATLASVGALWLGLRGTVAVGALLYLLAGATYPRLNRRPPKCLIS